MEKVLLGMMNTRRLGIIGEKIAQEFLWNNGYEILETNFYTKMGEIDIIAEKNNCIIFVEVKTRTSLKFGTPAMAVDFNKRNHIKNSAKVFLHINRLYDKNVRFDVIEVFINEGKCNINHIEGIM